MYKRIALALIAALFVLAAFTLTPFAGQTGLFSLFFASPSYSIGSLSVYQSDSNAIGSGTAVCTGVDISSISASCDGNLTKKGIYRFELAISNPNTQNGFPDQLMFLNSYAMGDVLGSDANLLYCGCLDDGTYKPGVPSFVGDDVNCNMISASQCNVEKNGGSETFYFVIGIGSNAASGTGSFFIKDEDKSVDDLSAETSFSFCNIACDSNASCNDSNALTADSCSNPGSCSSACVNVPCTVACGSDAACNDFNSLTVDSCSSPGTCSSACVNTPCTVACDSNASCNDSNSSTTDSCSNVGTCFSACVNTPIACTIACSSNASCADSNSLTIDTCSSPGTCSAACSHSACTPACYSNNDCNDSSALTTDICNNAGTCDANCSNSVCVPACDLDSDCDDTDPDTKDTCIHPGACGAHCLNEYCAPECSSDEDCGDSDPLTIDTCSNAGECYATCSNVQCQIACSSDSDCDDSKLVTKDSCSSPGTCLAKCSYAEQKEFVFEFVSDFNAVGRGNLVDLNVLVKDLNGNPVEGASIYFTDSAGKRIDLNSVGAGYYFAVYEVPADFVLGKQTLSFLASKGGLVGVEELVLKIAKGNVNALLLEPGEPKAFVGEKIEIKFALVYGNGDLVEAGNATASMNGVSIPLSADSNGVFTGYYLFSEADLAGAVLTVVSSDALGNEGSTSIGFSVQQPLPLFTLLVGVLIIIAVLIAAYGLKRTHRLSGLLRRAGKLEAEAKATKLQHSIEKEKGAREKLAKKIVAQEKELAKARAEVDFERKKQALAVSKLPMESKYAAHKAAFGLAAKLGKLFSRAPKKSAEQLKAEKRIQEIDAETGAMKEKIRNLEAEYCKQTIKEDFFRKTLFEYREKAHLLELEKKKIG